jgi:hypothetical protein
LGDIGLERESIPEVSREGGYVMLAQRGPTIERIAHRIEEHVEEWRRQDASRYAEVEAIRERLWAEAAERERLLAKAIGEEEARRTSVKELAKRQRRVFVVHSEEAAEALQDFARERSCLVEVSPGRASHANGSAIKGSWLVFEASE